MERPGWKCDDVRHDRFRIILGRIEQLRTNRPDRELHARREPYADAGWRKLHRRRGAPLDPCRIPEPVDFVRIPRHDARIATRSARGACARTDGRMRLRSDLSRRGRLDRARRHAAALRLHALAPRPAQPFADLGDRADHPGRRALATVCASAATAKYTTDGATTPTASIGQPLSAGSCVSLSGSAVLANFRVVSAAGTLDIEYFQ